MKKICLFPLFLLLVSCGGGTKPTPKHTPTPSIEPVTYVFNNPVEEFDIHTEAQRNYFLDSNYSKIQDYTGAGVVDESKSRALTISWETNRNDSNQKFYLSEHNDMSSSLSYSVSNNKIDISNLKIGTTYYYQVKGDEGESELSREKQKVR